MAIVRQPDTCWGQATNCAPDRLFGNAASPSTRLTEAWLRIWCLLSCGVIPAYSLSWHGAPGVRLGVIRDGAGCWVVTEDFLAPHVRRHVGHVIPPHDRLSYPFGRRTVTMRPIDGHVDQVSIEVAAG